ncbi:unnamed protein product [Arctogadus glacialis]
MRNYRALLPTKGIHEQSNQLDVVGLSSKTRVHSSGFMTQKRPSHDISHLFLGNIHPSNTSLSPPPQLLWSLVITYRTGQVYPLQARCITYREGGSPTGQVDPLQDRCINYSSDTPILPNFLLKLVEMVLYSSPRFFLAFHLLYQSGFLSDCHAIHQQ